MSAMDRIGAIMMNEANEAVLIDVAINQGFTYPKSGREDWDDREDVAEWYRNLLAQYQAVQEPAIKGEHEPHTHAFRVNKGKRDAMIFLKRVFPNINTPEKLLALLLERGATE
jgi:hypothetical protein